MSAIDEATLNHEELSLLDMVGGVAGVFKSLPQVHDSDVEDVVFHVHAIQNIILARAAYPRSRR